MGITYRRVAAHENYTIYITVCTNIGIGCRRVAANENDNIYIAACTNMGIITGE